MPHLILSDIHANLEALEAVLEDAEGQYDRIQCLGDLVGYGADPNAIVDWARDNLDEIIRGNHDKDCSGNDSLEHYRPLAIASALWTRAALTKASRDYLGSLARGPLRYGGYDLVHGSPADEDEYLLGPHDALRMALYLGSQVTFFGHTHVQGGFLLARGGVKMARGGVKTIATGPGTLELEPDYFYLVNPGAVGQPRDGDPRAAYALYWPDEHRVEYRRVEYDIAKAAGKVRNAGLPDPLVHRLFVGM